MELKVKPLLSMCQLLNMAPLPPPLNMCLVLPPLPNMVMARLEVDNMNMVPPTTAPFTFTDPMEELLIKMVTLLGKILQADSYYLANMEVANMFRVGTQDLE